MNIPENLRYTKDHEWVRIDGTTAYVGITDYAQEHLGDIVFIELPEIGHELSAGDDAATVESVKAVSQVYSPMSGKVTGVNETLEGTPEMVNNEPYLAWFYTMDVTDMAEFEALFDAAAYQKFCDEQ